MHKDLPETNIDKRVFGLDVVRTIAILSVLLGHIILRCKSPQWLKELSRLGFFGVEIFFVLSGFLIGGIIVRLITTERFSRPQELLNFWSRRWLRTLPLYYLMLLSNSILHWNGVAGLQHRIGYWFFLQNFAWPMPIFFRESWSLAVEEFFYLLFPLLCFLVLRLTRQPLLTLKLAIGLSLLAPIVLRWIKTPYQDWESFDFELRMVTVMRFDCVIYGVLAVFVKSFYPQIWSIWKRFTLVSALLFLFCCTYLIGYPGDEIYDSKMIQTFYFPAVSLSIAMLMPMFDDMKTCQNKILGSSITFISTISYSLYLMHGPIIVMLYRYYPKFDQLESPLNLILFLFVAFTSSTITYYFWECPFQRLRERFALSHVHKASAQMES